MISPRDLSAFCAGERVLIRGEGFLYLLPHPALRRCISNYTITFPTTGTISDAYTVIPHGGSTLVFACDGSGIHGNLFGPATRPCHVGDQANRFDWIIIVEFQPGGLYPFTGMGQRELADQVLPFALVAPGVCGLLVELLERSTSVRELVAGLDGLLLANLTRPVPPELALASRLILDHGGNISTGHLSEAVFYSKRHLNRIFGQHLGMGTKSFSRLVRVNKAIRLLHDPGNSITRVYSLTGFYDISHFIRDFKTTCGVTPQVFRDNVSDFYSEVAKF